MPPGPAFGWLCVLHSVTDIAVRAAQIRASQVLPARPVVSPEFSLRNSKAEERQLTSQPAGDDQANRDPPKLHTNHAFSTNINNAYLSHPEERQEELAPLRPRFEEDIPSEQLSTATYITLSAEPTLDPQLPDGPSLAVAYIPLEAEKSSKNTPSSEVTLDSGPSSIPIGTESPLCELESSVPLDVEVCL